ncbi:MAG: T9SS type A sorting domain-containing protein [Candidatus Krumholzibacteria bacterium]|nr:T9SS type A sorting domain-containing protein [Candidatus Krumholzibacteria bacterium]
MKILVGWYLLLSIFAFCVALPVEKTLAQMQAVTHEPTKPLHNPERAAMRSGVDREEYGRKGPDVPVLFREPYLLQGPIEGYSFVDNVAETGGFVFIPPDPHVAAGPDHVVNIGNVVIEWRGKSNPDSLQHRESLQTFFSALPGPVPSPGPGTTLGTFTFDPKVIYDQYADRFVVVTLEQWAVVIGDPSNESRVLLAVSKTSNPNDGWWFHAHDAKAASGGGWADYPGLAVDDKAVYLTANVFSFAGGLIAVGLWIIDKTPFYAGPDQSAVLSLYNPYTVQGFSVTTQPAHMYGPVPNGADGNPLGTYLVAYSGITNPSLGHEWVQVVEVTDPLGGVGGPFFGYQLVAAGDIEVLPGPGLPDAPQADTTATIEVNDRRALNAVWRDNHLYSCTTIISNSASDNGQTTAHWWKIDTSGGAGSLVMADEGDVGAEDLGAGTYTFFPSVMVDCLDNIAVGFSASNPEIYCGAYYAVHLVGDPPGTVRATSTLKAGTDYYGRTFDPAHLDRNRWGDYSGLALCPADEATFWVYNEYACERGTPIFGEDGRWCTALGSFRLKASPTAVASPTEGVFSVAQNHPNPFNPQTTITFTLPVTQHVRLSIYDVRGRLIRTLVNGTRPAGENLVSWNGTNSDGRSVGSGVYYYKLTAAGDQRTRKMVLLK